MADLKFIGEAKSQDYRLDLDGLRGIAVLAVIANHLNAKLLPGGYLGVDIFFVISGYVISLSLSKYKANKLHDFIALFFSRRIKRLFPALIVFVVIIGLAICLFSVFPNSALNTGIASLFGASNIYLYSQGADYFGESTLVNPFTHTWSLGVEEQFYFIFPFIHWHFQAKNYSAAKTGRMLIFLICTCFISAFLFAFLMHLDQPISAYYLLPSRFWEIGIGSIAFILQARAPIKASISNWLSSVGFMSVLCIVMLDSQADAIKTFSIAGATLLIIFFNEKNSIVQKLLANRLMVYIGKVSYSLYLWHWGIICLFRWTLGITWWSAILALIATTFCSLASYYFIEIPFRFNKKLFSPADILKIWAIALLSVMSLLLALKSGLHQYLYLGSRKIDYSAFRPGWGKRMLLPGTSISGKACHASRMISEIEAVNMFRNCSHPVSRSNERRTIAFLGDSHALALINAQIQAINNSYRVIHYSHSGCPFPKPSFGLRPKECEIFAERAEKLLLDRLESGDIIVIYQYALSHFGDKKLKDTRSDIKNQSFSFTGSGEEKIRSYVKGLVQFSEKARAKGLNILLVGAGIRNLDLPTLEMASREWFRPFPTDLSSSLEQETRNAKQMNNKFRSLIPKNVKNITFFDPTTELEQCCSSSSAFRLYYRDTDHLSDHGASVLMSKLLAKIAESRNQ
jgi:peptidoglycan/LPS O-acetylase OafA/YrhL